MNRTELKEMARLQYSRSKRTKRIARTLGVSTAMVSLFVFMLMMIVGYKVIQLSLQLDSYIIYYEKHHPIMEAKGIDIDIYNEIDCKDKISSYTFSFTAPLIEEAGCEEIVLLDNQPRWSLKSTIDAQVSDYLSKSGVYRSLNSDGEVVSYVTSIQLIDTEASDNRHTLNVVDRRYPLIDGEGFRDNAKQQVIISQRFIDFWGLDKEGIIGRKLSYRLDYSDYDEHYLYRLDDNNNPNDEYDSDYTYGSLMIPVFQDYEIVGILDDEVLSHNYDCDLIMSVNNLGLDELPIISYLPYIGRVLTYQDDDLEMLSNRIVDEGRIFPFMFFNGFTTPLNNKQYGLLVNAGGALDYPVKREQFEVGSVFESLTFGIRNNYILSVNGIDEYMFSMSVVRTISLIGFLMPALVVIGAYGIAVFMATLLNYINSLNYTLQIRKKSLNMLKIMGFPSKMFNALFQLELRRMFRLSIVFTIGAVILAGCVSLVLFKETSDILPLALATLIASILVVALSLLVSYVLSLYLAKKMTRTLYGGKKK